MTEAATRIAPRSVGASVASILMRRLARYIFALVLYLAVTAAYFGPLLIHLDSSVLVGFSDATLAIRGYDIADAAGATPFTFRHDALNGAPEGVPVLPQTQIAQPIQPAVIWVLRDLVGTVAALNLFLLVGVVLTAFAGFALLDWARLGMLPSLFGGFVIAFNPWMVERAIAGHVAFMHAWCLVLLLAALTKLRIVRTLPWAALAGLAYGLCFLVAAYMGLLATALVVSFAIVDLVSQESGRERLWTFTLLVVVSGVTLLALVPGLMAFTPDQDAVSSVQSHSLRDLQTYGTTLLDYLLPVSRHPLLGTLAGLRDSSTVSVFHEQDVFVGYAVLALAALSAVRLVRGTASLPSVVARRLVLLSAVAAPVALIASMQRELTVLGIGIPMPSHLIGEVTTFYRVYARLGYVVEIGLAVLAAAALHQLLSRGRREHAVGLALIVVAAFEFLPGTVSTATVGEPPAYDAWLARQPPGIVAHYPMMSGTQPAEKLAAAELYYQRFTHQPLFEIYGAGRRGTREDAIRGLSRYFDSPAVLRVLAAEKVRYVVIHDDVYRAQAQNPPSLGAGARLLRTFRHVRVYRVTAKPIDLARYLQSQSARIADQFGLVRPSVELRAGFYPPEVYERYNTRFQWMKHEGTVVVTNDQDIPLRTWLEGYGFSNGDFGKELERRLDLVDESGHAVATVTLPPYLVRVRLGPIVVPPGRSHFTLRSSFRPTSLGPGDSRVGSVFLSDLRATREPDLTRTLNR